MNRRRLWQLTAAVLTSDLTTRNMWATQRLSSNYTSAEGGGGQKNDRGI